MNQLITKDIQMTSLDIAEVTGKQHKHVLADVRKEVQELGAEIAEPLFRPGKYRDKNNQLRPYYELGKKGAMQLALKYDAKTRYKVIQRIEELENQQINKPSYMIDDPIKRAETWIVEHKEKQKLVKSNNEKEQVIKELKPKAAYTDYILKNKGLVTIGQIAKDYGMTAQEMNKLLHSLKIQYKRSGQWLLYRKYDAKGYVHSETIPIIRSDGRPDISMITKWTQKGRLFIYETLKNEKGVLPIIERENEQLRLVQ